MKAIDVILKYGWENDECDEAIKEIKTLEKQLEEYDSIVVGLNYKLAKAQSYIKYLEEQLGNSEDTVRAILEEGE